ncbi:histidine kinase [Acetobacter pasteurianus]|uniref:helix-turn-helix transcriptional regulator n=1 Tax=Acetobacter pasteurianus TaxID=438 RepID=UPI0022C6F903|nr:LuxR family transcriptional regulator [Acetobacter pasteurianus]GLH30370.1 histidine kinase [Acetobacter pasteurianus]
MSWLDKMVNKILCAASIDDLDGIIGDLCNEGSNVHAIYHLITPEVIGLSKQTAIHNYSPSWKKEYLEKEYFRVDPVLNIGARSFLPIDWSELPPQGAKSCRFFEAALDHGIPDRGLSIPIRGNYGERALFTVNEKMDTKNSEHSRIQKKRDILTIGMFFHDAFLRINKLTQPRNIMNLSKRERQCLTAAGNSKTAKEIAFNLAISEPAVRLYLRSARFKLKCNTTCGAVAKAVRFGLLD